MKTYYDILEVAADASFDEIKRSYRRLSLQYHPDRNKGDKYFEERFKEINAAYQVLKDSSSRNRYDTNLYYASQPHHETHQYTQAQQTAYDYEQQQWMQEQIRAQQKLNDKRFYKSVGLALLLIFALLTITKLARKKQDPYFPLVLNEELAVKLKKYEDGGRKDTALLNAVLKELVRRSEDPSLHAGLYANDSCQVSGTLKIDTLKVQRMTEQNVYITELQPFFFLQLPKSIFVIDKEDPSYESSNLVTAIQIVDPVIEGDLSQHLNRIITISCILKKGDTNKDEYPAFTKDVYKIEVVN